MDGTPITGLAVRKATIVYCTDVSVCRFDAVERAEATTVTLFPLVLSFSPCLYSLSLSLSFFLSFSLSLFLYFSLLPLNYILQVTWVGQIDHFKHNNNVQSHSYSSSSSSSSNNIGSTSNNNIGSNSNNKAKIHEARDAEQMI